MIVPASMIMFVGLTLNFQLSVSFAPYCELEVSCVKNSKPPVCYCDDACKIFNDCCYGFDNSTREQQQNQNNVTQKLEDFTTLENDISIAGNKEKTGQNVTMKKVPAALMDTCLRINDSIPGFWVVNWCPLTGRKCSENMTMNDVLRQLPVTDKQNVTYFGAECAICNGVMEYTTWGIYADGTKLSEDVDILSVINSTELETLPSTFGYFEQIQLIPPSLSIRVCYSFSTKTKNSTFEDCMNYQCPTIEMEKDEMFKNPECCEMSGECPTSQRTIAWTSVDHIATLDSMDDFSSRLQLDFKIIIPPGSLQQIYGQASSTSNTSKLVTTLLSSKFLLLKYHFRDDDSPYLMMTMDGEYDIRYVRLAYEMIYTYFWRSEWVLSLGDKVSMSTSSKPHCIDYDGICMKFEFRLKPMSTQNLNINQIYYLQSWIEGMFFSLEINLPWFSLEKEGDGPSRKVVSSIISHDKTGTFSECDCKQDYFTLWQIYEGHFTELLSTEWKTSKNDCTDHKLVLVATDVPPYKALEVYCNEKNVKSLGISAKKWNCFLTIALVCAFEFVNTHN